MTEIVAIVPNVWVSTCNEFLIVLFAFGNKESAPEATVVPDKEGNVKIVELAVVATTCETLSSVLPIKPPVVMSIVNEPTVNVELTDVPPSTSLAVTPVLLKRYNAFPFENVPRVEYP